MINLKKEYKDYLALLTILSFGLFGFVYLGYNESLQKLMVILIGVLYVGWGGVHHHLKGDLHLKVMLEYIAVAFFAIILVISLLSWS
jgi:hypothetical protein